MKTLVKSNIVTTASSCQCLISGYSIGPNKPGDSCNLCLPYCPVQTVNCSATKPGMSLTQGPTVSV